METNKKIERGTNVYLDGKAGVVLRVSGHTATVCFPTGKKDVPVSKLAVSTAYQEE